MSEHTTAGLDMPKFFGPTATEKPIPKDHVLLGRKDIMKSKVAGRVRLLRRFAPARLVDAGVRKNWQLDALTASLPRTPVLAK